jgi:hypothetical protein
MTTCEGCGVPVEQPRRGRRKWCSERCRKETRYSRKCLDCGAMCNTDGRVTNPTLRCELCARKHSRALSRQWILDSLADWVERFGAAPSATDWNPSTARSKNMHWAADRHAATGRPWPQPSLVIDNFGSWNAGLEAAGLESRPRGSKRGDPDPSWRAKALKLYASGLGSERVASELGVSTRAVLYQAHKAGIARSVSEAQALRFRREAA